MNTQIFSFTAIRSPQQAEESKTVERTITLFNPHTDTDFVKALREARKTNVHSMIKATNEFIRSDGYIKSVADLPPSFNKFNQYLLTNTKTEQVSLLRNIIKNIFDQEAADLVAADLFENARQNVADSLLSSLIKSDVNPQIKNEQARLMRIIGLIEKLASTDKATINLSSLLSSSFILPKEIFPLPADTSKIEEKIKKQHEDEKNRRKEQQEERKKLLNEIAAIKTAFLEIQSGMESEKINLNSSSNPKDRVNKKGFYLEAASANKLSQKSKEVVKKLNFELQKIDTSILLPKMETKLGELSEKLYQDVGFSSKIYKVGNVFLPGAPFDLPVAATNGAYYESPGPCHSTLQPTPVNETEHFVPEGKGKARVMGIMDLLMVEQNLLNYDKGEIAHIENVLIGETRERRHRKLTTREESVFTETEVTEEKENDLTSTERYELQVESQKVIEESRSFEAGITANAYGVSYDVSASANIAGTTTTSESNSSSSNFAREITTKAVNKITNRTLERRFIKTVQETEENNLHSFTNTGGSEHISGVYRWLDKIYTAQVVRYDKRLLMEFVIPEPAAFYRFALQQQPVENSMLLKPDEPGYCVGGSAFRPLRAKDITRENYLLWANKYNVSNVSPPPASYQIVGDSYAKRRSDLYVETVAGDDYLFYHAETAKITIPGGYYPEIAKVIVDFTYIDVKDISSENMARITVEIEDKQKIFNANNSNEASSHSDIIGTFSLSNFSTDFSTEVLPIVISSFGVLTFGVTITVFCKLSDRKFEEWQQKTFVAIMEAYNNQKAKYEEQLTADRINRGMGAITGRNPIFNRETERTELKKNCITMLTGQRFELFNSMLRNVIYSDGQYGYPEIVSFNDAEAEGNYIQFFEQCVEWSNMLYVFYPYFWAEKTQWVQLSQISDDDALFSKFLQAGSARVQVPIRPGFEFAVTTYLQTGQLWQAEGDFIDVNEDGRPDALQVSILQELKEGVLKSDESSGEPVGEPWRVRVPTSLVVIESDISTLIV